jgi:hypothetical protein
VLTGPHSEDVALPVHGDTERDVDRPVGDLPVADLGSVADLVIGVSVIMIAVCLW